MRCPVLLRRIAVEASQISLDVGAKAPREILPPRTFGGLHRRFDETLLRPALDIADAGIPQPRQNTPACGIAGTARRARAVIHVAIDNRLIDRLGFDVEARAESHQRQQSIARARVRQLDVRSRSHAGDNATP